MRGNEKREGDSTPKTEPTARRHCDKGGPYPPKGGPYPASPVVSALPISLRFYIYAVHGWVIEVSFTAIWNFAVRKDWRLVGETSVWSLFVYGINALFIEYIYMKRLKYVSIFLRMPLFIILGYTWEYFCGYVLRIFDACPWDYSERRWQLHGLITLEYLPAWTLCYLFCEKFIFVYSCVRLRLVHEEVTASTDDVLGANEETVDKDADSTASHRLLQDDASRSLRKRKPLTCNSTLTNGDVAFTKHDAITSQEQTAFQRIASQHESNVLTPDRQGLSDWSTHSSPIGANSYANGNDKSRFEIQTLSSLHRIHASARSNGFPSFLEDDAFSFPKAEMRSETENRKVVSDGHHHLDHHQHLDINGKFKTNRIVEPSCKGHVPAS